MKVARTKAELAEAMAAPRAAGATVGLVPTMGYLHEGHRSLLRRARAECGIVVISLFVNPAQFGPGEDLETYPRDEGRDLDVARAEGVDVVFAPAVEELYPDGFATAVEVTRLTEVLCGDPSSRGPGHFRGVTTVVAKLFNIVRCDTAYFGQKDGQQAAVIRRMAADLDFGVRIEVLPTVREPDGLAMSSRNSHLGAADRERAAAIHRALETARAGAEQGSLADALGAARDELRAAGIEPEYLEARDAEDLEPVAALNGRPIMIAVAARVGGTRLIDNILLGPVEGSERREDE